MSSPEPESFYRAPASALESDRPSGPGPRGRFQFGAAWSYAFFRVPHQYLPAMAVVIVAWALMIIGYLTCAGILLTLPHILAGMTLAGLTMTRGHNGFASLFAAFMKYPRILVAGSFVLIGGSLLQGLPFLLHIAIHPEQSESMSAEYLNSLEGMYTWPVFGLFLFLSTLLRFYFTARMLPLAPLIVERDLGLFAATRAAWQFTRDDQLSLTGLIALTTIINYLGVILLCLGYFFTAPLTLLVKGAALRQLLGELGANASEESGWFEAIGTTNTDQDAASNSASDAISNDKDRPAPDRDRDPYA